MSENKHGGKQPESAPPGEELDTVATTLLVSGSISKKDGSYETEGKNHADIDLDEPGQTVRKRGKDFERPPDSINEDDEDEQGLEAREDHRLLADDAVALIQTQPSVTTIPDDGELHAPLENEEKPKPVSWRSLPRKGQLAILTLARLSEPLTQTSLQSYMFYQLKSFKNASGQTPSNSLVASQAGLLAAAFTGAQFCTALMWGRLADWEGLGRKRVILIGLLGSAIGSLGFGFSQSFAVAMFWRAVGGILNGNIGIMRTMISEIVKEKKYQSRAFLLLPMTFNIGVIIGPLLGGILADPVGSYPGLFGPGSTFGGKDGVWLFTRWPYALPNLVNATFLTLSALALILGLEETLDSLRDRNDYGLRIGKWILRSVFRRTMPKQEYIAVLEHDNSSDVELSAGKAEQSKTKRKLPFRRIWTKNVLFTFLAHGLLAMHVGTFSSLWFVFLSTPRYNADTKTATANDVDSLHLPQHYHPKLPFFFTGGLALPPPAIGTALAILGVIGITLQLLLYPRMSFILGTITSYRLSLLLFPFSYILAPFLAVIPSTTSPPSQASGALVWLSITLVLSIQVLARTFALPSTAILINNACPHPSVLGSVHGVGQSVSSATRTVGPVLAGWIYGVGLEKGVVGLAWWCMAGLSVAGAVAGRWVKEGDGHEIWLEGEREEDEEGRGKR